jgi:oligosaccharide repeat unit polymerase
MTNIFNSLTSLIHKNAGAKKRKKIHIHDVRIYILILATLWWLLLASINSLELSLLQVEWSFDATFAIYIYIPVCFLICIIPILTFPLKSIPDSVFRERRIELPLRIFFYFFIFLFLIQAIIFTPPAFTGDPSAGRLEWGFKYVHVLSEIFIRAGVLACAGAAASRGYISRADAMVLLASVIYAILVVSRGLILEILIYFIFASILSSRQKFISIKIRRKHIIWFSIIWLVFIVYGEWRQGDEFSISEYGEMLIDSNVIAWIFGYFLVNYDNLALIIMNDFRNDSLTNIFGPLLQTLQILNYEEIDDYLYVGRFNLGTALRPFVLDYGPWFGGLAFSLLLSLVLLLPNLCRFSSSRFAILISLTYMTLLFPVTSRIELPAYVFPLILIIIFDRFFRVKFARN